MHLQCHSHHGAYHTMHQTSAHALLPQPRVLSPGEGVSTWKLPLCIRGPADALVASNAHPDIVDEAALWFRDLGVAACKADAMPEAGSQGGTHGVVTMELLDDETFKQLPVVQQALTSAPHPPQGALLQQAYSADIDAHGCATVHATTRRGLFYGVQTLVQWLVVHNRDFVQTIRAFGGGDDGDGALHADVSARESKHGATDEAVSLACPSAVVVDWPDILHRGVMLDVSRDRVWTMATLRATVRRLAHMKVNQLQLYMEHTFQYHDHREVWHGSGAYSGSVLCVSLL